MMKWFRRTSKTPIDTVTPEQAAFDGRLLSYVTKRVPDEFGSTTEIVIGKDGRFCAVDGVVSIICGDREVFRCAAAQTTCGELMSHNGVIVTGVNQYSGECETLVAHFSYYRS